MKFPKIKKKKKDTGIKSLKLETDISKLLNILQTTNDKKTCFQNVRQLINDSKVKDFTALYKFLFDEIDNYAKGHLASVILILAEAQYQDAFAVDKELHVMATMVKIMNELK